MQFRNIDAMDAQGKRVLLRADLNVPVRDGVITDRTRIERLAPTIRELAEKGARVIICSHFDRPKGKRVPEMSLQPMVEALSAALDRPVAWAEDCIGPQAEAAVAALADGEVLLLENTRFHAGEEKNDPAMAAALAKLADVYVNDAFSAAHRAHASTEGVAHLLPAYPGRLMEAELKALDAALGNPARPVVAIVGGAKISTKLELLGNLTRRVNVLVIGGAMANTFLAAQGHPMGRSLQEAEMHDTARTIMAEAQAANCEILLPVDLVVASEFAAQAPHRTVAVDRVPQDMMALDVGPDTVELVEKRLRQASTLVWNGPFGAFEIPPFDTATVAVAQSVAGLTSSAGLKSIAGGGDTVSALRHAGVMERLTYVSSAGGAFLEWLEGKTLPGVKVLETA
ncbi:phosphoglycerate kinase [Roseomonas frigidaquae]|uniref:Phosphoglycerate kinase n=1 Tax=Falsiroseomonas frigidaquae TaxID=487318 RepID=A0ABX1F7G3_9PROT|nr:phosphoglycerate kinase [Falsiroseomonas frigidaquae]NKE48248.1 phosphoglycerate kinase [Falsiroseomonas frigidaquae]